MAMRLPDELPAVVIAHPGVPLELLDGQTHTAYVLLASTSSRCTGDSSAEWSATCRPRLW